jgi:hypothetical protein
VSKIKVERDPFEAKGPFLCCTLNKGAECTFCHERMCIECAKAWSPRKHFILDMCRKRFTPSQLDDAAKCYEGRIKQGKANMTGSCEICMLRKVATHNDRRFDRIKGDDDYDDYDDFDWLNP